MNLSLWVSILGALIGLLGVLIGVLQLRDLNRRMLTLMRETDALRKNSKRTFSVSPRLPLWALILFEPEEAQRWSREVESHIWELLELQEFKQARRDRRKLIVRGLLLAIGIRLAKRLKRGATGRARR